MERQVGRATRSPRTSRRTPPVTPPSPTAPLSPIDPEAVLPPVGGHLARRDQGQGGPARPGRRPDPRRRRVRHASGGANQLQHHQRAHRRGGDHHQREPVEAVAGLIVPGDKVDLMGTFTTGTANPNSGTTAPSYEHFFYQNVNVIAIRTTAAPTAGNTGAVTNPGSTLFTSRCPPKQPSASSWRPPATRSTWRWCPRTTVPRPSHPCRGRRRRGQHSHPVRQVVPSRNGDVVGTMDESSTMTGTAPRAFSFAVAIVDDDPRLRTRLGVQVGDIGQAGTFPSIESMAGRSRRRR